MGKCIVCGKKGLFLKVDSNGRCNECAKEIEKEEVKKFELYYTNLLHILQDIKESVYVGNDPIKALGFIPKFTDKIEKCDVLKSEIHEEKYAKRLFDRLINSIEYRDEFSKRHGMGYLKDWGISVFADVTSNQYSEKMIFSRLDESIDSVKHQWKGAVNGIKRSADFQREIDGILTIEVKLSESKYKKQSVSELDDLIKYTNITSKTSFNKIGSFVVLDTETTGLSCVRDSLVEVAAIRFEDWTPVEKFHTLINPGKPIPVEASEVNNITDEMVANAPTFSQIIDSLSKFIGKSTIVGHNLPFDLKFLYRNGFDFITDKRKYYDTCEIAKKTLKKPKMKWDKEYEEYVINDNYDYDVENYKLTTLCDYYSIRDNKFAHRALSDALATGLLFRDLAKDRIGD